MMTPNQFIAQISRAAMDSYAKTGVFASFVVAEGALESGWGNSTLTQQAMNIFGVKADPSWKGDTYSIQTREFLNGQWAMVPALWRKYNDWGGCIADHAAFLRNNPRYAAAFLCKDGEAFAQAVAAAGYATDPTYATKIISIMRAHNLAALDVVAT